MATVKQFEDLGVWQDARVLVKAIYATSKQRWALLVFAEGWHCWLQ